MSNFVCPTCGFTNIDCGKDGYKTLREIELEEKYGDLLEKHINECLDCDKFDFYKQAEDLKEKLEIAKNCMNSAAQFLTCMDDLSELYEKSNEQLALEVLNKGLEELRNDKI